MKIFIIGANGMIGSGIFKYLSKLKALKCYALIRSSNYLNYLPDIYQDKTIVCGDLQDFNKIKEVVVKEKPDMIINCCGITKHVPDSSNFIKVVKLNSLLPHLLSNICSQLNIRFVQVSTDCVFSGLKGNYTEQDIPDPIDFYGQSKHLGEVDYHSHLTIRTSTIGHEINSQNGLLEWFLNQKSCEGFEKAIFSGITTLELAKIINEIILTNDSIKGMYHISSVPIDKYSLLRLISNVYKHDAQITKNREYIIDRSLNSDKFYRSYNYKPPSWEEMVSFMHSYSLEN